jgi:hypothetical protein
MNLTGIAGKTCGMTTLIKGSDEPIKVSALADYEEQLRVKVTEAGVSVPIKSFAVRNNCFFCFRPFMPQFP